MYWVKFAAFLATIGGVVLASSFVAALIGMPAASDALVGIVASIAGIAIAVRVFSVPTVPLAWMVRELPARELPATGLATAA